MDSCGHRHPPGLSPRTGRSRLGSVDGVDGERSLSAEDEPGLVNSRVRADHVSESGAEVVVRAPFTGVVIAAGCKPGESIRAGAVLAVLEAMKMEHEVLAQTAGVVVRVEAAVGQTVEEGQALVVLGERETSEAEARDAPPAHDVDGASAEREDLRAVRERHAFGLDGARDEAVARRHATGRRTARENLADLVDEGTFVEYGPLVFAAQERRRAREELIERTPADGLVGGVGDVEGRRCVVASYDYMVLAGTQGMRGHQKKDRLFEIAERSRLPVVLLAEGGGGRPGDVDWPMVAGLDCRAFHLFARLSGLVPLVGVVAGYCFAGNAALLGCCDVVIATEDSSIGMGGPAMIEGGGLGVHAPAEVGPIEVQDANGVVDLRVADECAAVAAAKRYLSYFNGSLAEFAVPDQSTLAYTIPVERKRVYDVRRVLRGLCDEDSVLELRAGWAPGMLTALARVDGRSLGVVANDPTHLGGAIDANGADKAARFMQLCDAFELPLLFLCDTPGFMVGSEAERTATVRHFARMFVTGANLTVPTGTIVLRKGYGLGAQAMAGGGFKAPLFTVGWPTSEFGGMGLEGAVRLGMRRELEAIEDEEERERVFAATVAAAYEHGRGLNMAAYGEIDDVIDPADSRRWIATLFDEAAVSWRERPGKKRPFVDAW
jgi:acetyl-CoA carboxylase carboxyltransferase component